MDKLDYILNMKVYGPNLSFSNTKLVADIVNDLLYLVLFNWFTGKSGGEQVVPGSTSGSLIPKNQVNDQKDDSFIANTGFIILDSREQGRAKSADNYIIYT